MENKKFDLNSLIGFILIGGILIWMLYRNAPTEEELQEKATTEQVEKANETNEVATPTTVDSTQVATTETDSIKQARANEQLGSFGYSNQYDNGTVTTFENDVLFLKVANKGGQIVEAKMKNFKTYDSIPVHLIKDNNASFNINFKTSDNRSLNTENLAFEPTLSKSGDNQVLSMKLKVSNSEYLEYRYELKPGEYMLDFSINSKGLEKTLAVNYLSHFFLTTSLIDLIKRNKKFLRKSKILKKKFKIKKRKKSRKTKKKILKRQKRKTKKIKSITSKVKLKKIKLPNFNKQINQFKKLSFRKVMSLIFKPLIKFFEDYRQKKKIEKLRKIEKERREKEKQIKLEELLRRKLKEQELRQEIRIERERKKDIKNFLRKEQAEIRKEQAERQRKFLFELKLEKQIENFKKREVKELQNLERIALKEERSDYAGLQARIEKLKEKYRAIRDQKIKERVEALGVEVQQGDDRDALLEKEKQYTLERQKIENCLESFYRSSVSLCFQINKRYIPKHRSILRVIDLRFEQSEIYIRWDDAPEEDWLLLIYIKNNLPKEGIVIEDKSDPEKNISHEFKTTEIFKASDMMVDSLIRLLERERKKKAS